MIIWSFIIVVHTSQMWISPLWMKILKGAIGLVCNCQLYIGSGILAFWGRGQGDCRDMLAFSSSNILAYLIVNVWELEFGLFSPIRMHRWYPTTWLLKIWWPILSWYFYKYKFNSWILTWVSNLVIDNFPLSFRFVSN